MAQTAYLADTAGCLQCARNPRQGADRVAAGLIDLANNKHLDGPQLAHGHGYLHAVDLLHAALQKFLNLSEGQSRHLDWTDAVHENTTVSTDPVGQVLIEPAPHQHFDFIAGPDDVIVTHWHVADGSESRNIAPEQAIAVLSETGQRRWRRRGTRLAYAPETHLDRRRGLVYRLGGADRRRPESLSRRTGTRFSRPLCANPLDLGRLRL